MNHKVNLSKVSLINSRTSGAHRDIASNNSRKLQQLGTQVTINIDTATSLRTSASSAKLRPRHTPETSERKYASQDTPPVPSHSGI